MERDKLLHACGTGTLLPFLLMMRCVSTLGSLALNQAC